MKTLVSQPEEKLAECLKRAKVQWFYYQLSTWGTLQKRSFSWRRTTDPYAIFVAEFLLQKTNAAKVETVYETFLARYPTISLLAAATVDEVARILQPLGLHFRALRLCQSARKIQEEYEGKIPDTETLLQGFPGVGKYTARSICANAYNKPLAVLDTNVARILERFFGLRGNRVKSRCKLLWRAAELIAPTTEVGKWNLTLLDFGAAVCTAKNPLCADCPLLVQCDYAKLNFNKK